MGGLLKPTALSTSTVVLTLPDCVLSFTWPPRHGWCEAPLNALATHATDPHLVCVASMDGTARVVNLATRKVVHVVDHNDSETGGATMAAAGGDEDADEASASVEW